jgi:dolichol-phosphate mannosyltransferase
MSTHRRIGIALAALLDALLVCVLLRSNIPPEISQWCGYGVGFVLLWALTRPPPNGAETALLARGLTLAALAGLGLWLQSGVLTLLVQTWHWVPQAAIFLAAPVGLAVLYWARSACASAGSPAHWRAFAIGFIAYAFALRLIFAGTVELMPEETYYWNYAQHLDLGYLDHPPLIAWLIHGCTLLFGQTEFAVRLSALLCGAIASFFIYRLTRNLFGREAALAALLLAQGLPFFFLAGLLMTPDAPLTAAWAASLYFLERALVGAKVSSWWFAGICLGLGLISKYTILILGSVAVLYMLWDAPARRWWLRFPPYGAALLALLIFTPVILWNAQHEWASFVFQTSRRLAEAPRFSLHKLLASAFILITPTGVIAVIYALARRPASAGDPTSAPVRVHRLLALAILFPLTIFLIFSLRHEVKLDWTGAPWVAALPLLAQGLVASTQSLSRGALRLRNAWAPTLTIMLMVYGAGLCYLTTGLPGLPYSGRMELLPVGWKDFSRQIDGIAADYQQQTGTAPVIVGMDRYAIASEMWFYGLKQTHAVPEISSVHLFGGIGLMYERWSPAARLDRRTLLLVAEKPGDMADAFLAPHAERLGPIEKISVSRDGKTVRDFAYRFAYGYRAN